MAEIAGLVIGGISLAALFDQCITIIKYVDSGRQCSDNYRHAALMLTLLGGRLNRWERSLRDNADLQTTEFDGETAEMWLKHIKSLLEDAERLGQRYNNGNTDLNKRSTTASTLVENVQGMVLCRKPGISLAKKARWALIDEEKMSQLIDKLDKVVGSLEQLFSSLQDRRIELLKNDVSGLLEFRAQSDSPQAIQTLESAAARVDQSLEIFVQETGHSYRNIESTDRAMVNIGNYYSGEILPVAMLADLDSKHKFDGIRCGGQSKVNLGNMYGKSVFELRNT